MPGSKPGALPLGDGPTNEKTFFIYTEQEVPEKLKLQLRTCACQDPEDHFTAGALPIFTQTWGDGPTNAKLFLLGIAQEVPKS